MKSLRKKKGDGKKEEYGSGRTSTSKTKRAEKKTGKIRKCGGREGEK